MSGNPLDRIAGRPSLSRLVGRQLAVWPDHEKYLGMVFADADDGFLARAEELAELQLKIIGDDLDRYCGNYMWMCRNFNDEQLHFRRTKKYRYSTFQEAYDNVYGNDEYMERYVCGILLSQLFWKNHALAMDYYRTRFLPAAPDGYHHLEVGPGHGLFLYFAARDPRAGSVTAWELSNSSIAATRGCLERFGVAGRVSLVQNDVLKAKEESERFDTILMSEVLEHIERPELALDTLRRSLKHSGRLLLNVPINSPAPDHIYLWTSPAELDAFLTGCGLETVAAEYIPVTGYTLDEALARNLAVSCVLTCRRTR